MVAYSLHELGRILGMEQTCSDLLPIFEEYCTKDVDDVKLGTLAHLTDFFEVRETEPVTTSLKDSNQERVKESQKKAWYSTGF